MFIEGFYPFNASQYDPNIRGEAPVGIEVHRDIVIGAMVAGVKAVEIPSAFGKGLGEVWGCWLLNNAGAGANEALVATASNATGTDGTVTVTVQSSDAAAIDNNTRSIVLFGRIVPINA